MAWFHLHPLLTACTRGRMRVFLRGDWMAVPLHIVEFRARPPTPSSWPCADASQKPLHSLTLLSPSSHGLAGQNSAIVPPRGVHRLANSPGSHSYAPCTVCTNGFKTTAWRTWTCRKKKVCSHIILGFFFFFYKLNSSPVVPTVCPSTLISSQWKPSTSLNPKSLCVFISACVCYCGSVCLVSKCINL